MNEQKHKKGVLFLLIAGVLLFGGCGAQPAKELRICPGAGSAGVVTALLRERSRDVESFKANGSCIWRQSVDGKVHHRENFNVKLWVGQAGFLRLQGDIAFDPTGIVLGSNEQEYWLAIKPLGISSYWWGHWERSGDFGRLKINPKVLLEAVGIVEIGENKDWKLHSEDGFDVLSLESEEFVKKIYVFNCDRTVSRIEYYDLEGTMLVWAELDNYVSVNESFHVPRAIRLVSRTGVNIEDSFEITLGTVKRVDLTDKQREKLFNRPEMRGFETIVEDGVLIKSRGEN